MTTFSELKLVPSIQRALQNQQFVTPTPIQSQTIPPALNGRDVMGTAQTGTGKTAAFALPILNRLGKKSRKSDPCAPAALVLAPTRELAIQIHESFRSLGADLRLRSTAIYGGVNQTRQVRQLERGVHILIATPGRLLDLMEQGFVDLSRLRFFVLDEADRMLDMGFLPDLKRIVAALPDQRQSLFFSATMSPAIQQLADGLLDDPVRVTIDPDTTTAELVDHRVLFVERHQKRERLRKILKHQTVQRALVFVRTKRGADVLSKQLLRDGIQAEAIHGNKSQNARLKALDSFRDNRLRVLVATDVAARGIDVDNITHVVNFDLPNDPENYVHRIGRTGRAGSHGIAVSLCENGERKQLRAIESFIRTKIPVQNPGQPNSVDSQEKSAKVMGSRGDSKRFEGSSATQGTNEESGSRRPKRRRRRTSSNRRKRVSSNSAQS